MKYLVEHLVGSMPTAIRPPSWLGNQKQALLTLLWWFTVNCLTAKNPRDNFCRRYAHQTTVIDDKLYIDGGWVNFDDFQQDHKNYSNTWLGYHDLNKLVDRPSGPWPDLNISLNKNDSIPTVYGGVLWGDDVNKRFYLFGGERTVGSPKEPYRLLSYDILNDEWDDFGSPNMSPPPNIASYGAGVGVSETGMGYYYGGWISNTSMDGWTQPRTMSPDFYTYSYDTQKFTRAATIGTDPRAEGAMVWISAGDKLGLLVYMGGIISPFDNDTTTPQPFDEIFVFDATGNSWSTQKATGEIPQNRRQFCIDVAWAPDKSSFNIYLWGGLSVPPPVVNATSFSDVYILTLPSFIWVKAYPDHHGNATLEPPYRHYSASCNMVKSMSQLFVIGGTYTDTDACDLAYDAWAQHNFWTGTSQNAGDNTKKYWDLYDPNVTTNVVPTDVYSVVGGDKYGGATLVGPKDGFDSGNKPLQDLLGRRPSIAARSPTRHVPAATNSSTPKLTPPGSGLSTGAIIGIAIASAVGLALVLFVWLHIGRKVVRRREERRQSSMTQPSYYTRFSVGSTAAASGISPQTSMGPCEIGSRMESSELPSPLPPFELPAQQYGSIDVANPSPGHSPPHVPSLMPEAHML